MLRQDAREALASWVDVGLLQARWHEPLTLSLTLTGARALALGARGGGADIELLGWSSGAPAQFLNFCRDLGAASVKPGAHERSAKELGRIYWVTIGAGDCATVLFASYDDVTDRSADTNILQTIAEMAQNCVAARAQKAIPRPH